MSAAHRQKPFAFLKPMERLWFCRVAKMMHSWHLYLRSPMSWEQGIMRQLPPELHPEKSLLWWEMALLDYVV